VEATVKQDVPTVATDQYEELSINQDVPKAVKASTGDNEAKKALVPVPLAHASRAIMRRCQMT
jgi:hypothetical protein